ncbi:hypothetical protein MMC21_005768 [Puttea exsequens]|nr:hypothetical protein [Puttea exsequens]
MSKAGPLTRARSKLSRQTEAETTTQIWAGTAKNWRDDPQPPQRRGEFGRPLHSDEIVIGLALGNPSQNPLPSSPPESRDADASFICSSPEPPSMMSNISEAGTGASQIKRKGSKWKQIGSLFGRGKPSPQSSETSPFYQLDHAQAHGEKAEAQGSLADVEAMGTNNLRRKRADTAQTNSSQVGTKGETGGLLRRNSSRRRGLGRRRKVEEMNPELENLHHALSAHATTNAWHPPPTHMLPPSLLQVEIPSVELERYSVMFGDVLQSQSKRQSALLSRRQVNLEGIKPVTVSEDQQDNDTLPRPHARHDSTSSRSSTKSPSFSLFPPSPKIKATKKSLPKPSPLGRSITTPAANALSPPQTTIRKTKSQENQVFLFVSTPQDSPTTPTAHDFKPRFDPPSPSANSTNASFFECPEYPGYSFEDDLPTPTTKSAKQTFLQRAFPARKDSIKAHAGESSTMELSLQKPLTYQKPNDSMNTIVATAEVSIARQISISRRQQQMLVPIASQKTARQPMRPKLVNSQSTSALRKSHHPTLSGSTIGTGL